MSCTAKLVDTKDLNLCVIVPYFASMLTIYSHPRFLHRHAPPCARDHETYPIPSYDFDTVDDHTHTMGDLHCLPTHHLSPTQHPSSSIPITATTSQTTTTNVPP